MTEQILAISPILPGQKVNHEYDIPPHSPSASKQLGHDPQPSPHPSAPTAGPENDLIDFGYPSANEKAVSANKQNQAGHRDRSASLMDDDQHVNAMNDKMGNMRLMEPTRTPASPPADKKNPLQRTDTQTSEVDAFFDAEA